MKRDFRGARLHIEMKRDPDVKSTEVYVNGALIEDSIIRDLKPGNEYQVSVKIPEVV
ncbi:hypothetical protein D3C78_1957900 [compost metagenome]